ncbi:non-specific serine/threonine protein kinase [Trifolium repens]|nr:non-specific serine/threonine protein kinase [Trifolium repens]
MFNTRNPCFLLNLLNLIFSLQSYLSHAAITTISANQSLSGDQTLVSEGGIFELGFFKPGQIKQYTWLESTQQWNLFWSQPRGQCAVHSFCGPSGSCTEYSKPYCNCLSGFEPKSLSDWDLGDHSGGCIRKKTLQCEGSDHSNRDNDGFLAIPNMALPIYAQSVGLANAAECELTCLKNCSCTAYAYDSNGCSIWIGDLINLQLLSSDDSSGKILYVKLATSELRDASKNSSRARVIIGGVVGAIISIGILLALLLRNSDPSADRQVTFFPTLAAKVVNKGGNVLSLLDPRLEGNADIVEVTEMIKVASWCVQENETQRPTMRQVVQILEGILDVNLPPIPRFNQVFVDN